MTNSSDAPPTAAPGSGVDARSVLDALVRAVVVTDPDGQIVLWNRSAEELYGWAEHEVLGRSILEVLAPDDEFAANHQDLTAVAGGKVMSGDRLVTRRDGHLLRVMTFTRPLFDESGTTIALVGSSEDVGARRDAEQQAPRSVRTLPLGVGGGRARNLAMGHDDRRNGLGRTHGGAVRPGAR